MGAPILRYFTSGHLKTPQRDIAQRFEVLAHEVDDLLPAGPETTVSLRKLLEAKDAAVRSSLDLATGNDPRSA